jgi:DNA-directed RNA polymerase specialized sigma24 family protein
MGTVMSRLHRGRKAVEVALYDYAAAKRLITDTKDTTSHG